jgi:hypothetical protein
MIIRETEISIVKYSFKLAMISICRLKARRAGHIDDIIREAITSSDSNISLIYEHEVEKDINSIWRASCFYGLLIEAFVRRG